MLLLLNSVWNIEWVYYQINGVAKKREQKCLNEIKRNIMYQLGATGDAVAALNNSFVTRMCLMFEKYFYLQHRRCVWYSNIQFGIKD